jgi:hypothetical protein
VAEGALFVPIQMPVTVAANEHSPAGSAIGDTSLATPGAPSEKIYGSHSDEFTIYGVCAGEQQLLWRFHVMM